MIFTSFTFILLFPFVFVLYYAAPSKLRWIVMLIVNYLFYIYIKPVYSIILAGITLSTYIFTILISSAKIESRRKLFMIINIVIILLPLVFFKYFTMIDHGLMALLNSAGINWPVSEMHLILPVGISFYTFTAIGYTIDVYNEDISSEKNLGILALFISFFPLVLSGPIERGKNLIPQFKANKSADYFMIVKGLKFILWGFFMKLVVAERIGIYVNAIYDNILQHNGSTILFASILYPFQVYADLGGYSLIAIGTASVFNINVMQNFKRPFFSASMAEFWRRWHISLITWLTDYIYTPLSFYLRKYKIMGIVTALMITFIISGIWHGASLTFIIWGAMQGLFLSIEALAKRNEIKYHLRRQVKFIIPGMALTFILFAASLVFARSADLSQAVLVFDKIFTSKGAIFYDKPSTLIFIFLGLISLLAKDFAEEYLPHKIELFNNRNKYIRVLSYGSIIIIILLIGVLDGGQFIYFQF